METELDYALHKKDSFWVEIRLRHRKESVLDIDPDLPEKLRPRAKELYDKFRKTASRRCR